MSRYSEIVMDHFEDPRNCGPLESATVVGRVHPHHGPRMTIYLEVAEGIVQQASFEARGCGFSIAACSLLTELVESQTTEACCRLTAQQLDQALGELPMDKKFAASLAIEALHAALTQLPDQEH